MAVPWSIIGSHNWFPVKADLDIFLFGFIAIIMLLILVTVIVKKICGCDVHEITTEKEKPEITKEKLDKKNY
jgi:hypothetical protein